MAAFRDAVRTEAELRALVSPPTDNAHRNQLDGPAEVLRDHVADGASVTEVQARLHESYTERLW